MASLIFTPRTQLDANKFSDAIHWSDFYAEWNTGDGYFSFEEAEGGLDALEIALTELLNENDINGHFEAE